ncbi:putative Pectate lyase C [Seiridium unicorne]|uniref:Pectate lyase C n=1 Tax=Seiridium unicorne TaxID=138068 RepID=A0ABR2V4K2_9PEZI
MGASGDSGKDGFTIAEGENMIFDQVSVTWGRDETFSINGDVYNVPIKNSIIDQGLEIHSCGGLIQTDYRVSLIRNLYIDNKTRNPKVKGMNDFQNNVIYNWGGGGGYIAGDSDGQSYANIISNYCISGPDTSVTAFNRGNANFHGFSTKPCLRGVEVSENYYDSDQNGALDGSALCVKATCYADMDILTTKYDYPGPSTLMTAANAVTWVLNNVGANYPSRDSVDKRLLSEVQTWGTTGELISDETASPIWRRIPDVWEQANGLDYQDASDAMAISSSGYANTEVCVNSLVPSTNGS